MQSLGLSIFKDISTKEVKVKGRGVIKNERKGGQVQHEVGVVSQKKKKKWKKILVETVRCGSGDGGGGCSAGAPGREHIEKTCKRHLRPDVCGLTWLEACSILERKGTMAHSTDRNQKMKRTPED